MQDGRAYACYAASLDRRTLGERLFGFMADSRALDLADGALYSGFHPVEQTAQGACRWTTGDAYLSVPLGTSTVTLRLGDNAATLPRIPGIGRARTLSRMGSHV